MDINAVFSDPAVEDMTLVNGQYQPVLQDLSVSVPFILRVVGALGGGIVRLQFPSASSSVCSLRVLAYDGVYLTSSILTNDLMLVEGGRADVEVVCRSAAVHDLVAGEDLLVMQLNVSGVGDTGATVTDAELGAIVRPSYLADLTGPEVEISSQYSTAFWQDDFNQSICGEFI